MLGIDGGISNGFGVKYPDYVERSHKIQAENDYDAIIKAAGYAFLRSRNHLSNPETEYTKVKINSIYSSTGLVNQRSVLESQGKKHIEMFEFEDDCLVTKCSDLEHLILLTKMGERDS
ncbi:MAG TPA: hypothetical protein VEC16_00275 [Alphaproteobacteria bacterium]|nr:hypothetical protein [Alphaproteobacteria bacterium]